MNIVRLSLAEIRASSLTLSEIDKLKRGSGKEAATSSKVNELNNPPLNREWSMNINRAKMFGNFAPFPPFFPKSTKTFYVKFLWFSIIIIIFQTIFKRSLNRWNLEDEEDDKEKETEKMDESCLLIPFRSISQNDDFAENWCSKNSREDNGASESRG